MKVQPPAKRRDPNPSPTRSIPAISLAGGTLGGIHDRRALTAHELRDETPEERRQRHRAATRATISKHWQVPEELIGWVPYAHLLLQPTIQRVPPPVDWELFEQTQGRLA